MPCEAPYSHKLPSVRWSVCLKWSLGEHLPEKELHLLNLQENQEAAQLSGTQEV